MESLQPAEPAVSDEEDGLALALLAQECALWERKARERDQLLREQTAIAEHHAQALARAISEHAVESLLRVAVTGDAPAQTSQLNPSSSSHSERDQRKQLSAFREQLQLLRHQNQTLEQLGIEAHQECLEHKASAQSAVASQRQLRDQLVRKDDQLQEHEETLEENSTALMLLAQECAMWQRKAKATHNPPASSRCEQCDASIARVDRFRVRDRELERALQAQVVVNGHSMQQLNELRGQHEALGAAAAQREQATLQARAAKDKLLAQQRGTELATLKAVHAKELETATLQLKHASEQIAGLKTLQAALTTARDTAQQELSTRGCDTELEAVQEAEQVQVALGASGGDEDSTRKAHERMAALEEENSDLKAARVVAAVVTRQRLASSCARIEELEVQSEQMAAALTTSRNAEACLDQVGDCEKDCQLFTGEVSRLQQLLDQRSQEVRVLRAALARTHCELPVTAEPAAALAPELALQMAGAALGKCEQRAEQSDPREAAELARSRSLLAGLDQQEPVESCESQKIADGEHWENQRLEEAVKRAEHSLVEHQQLLQESGVEKEVLRRELEAVRLQASALGGEVNQQGHELAASNELPWDLDITIGSPRGAPRQQTPHKAASCVPTSAESQVSEQHSRGEDLESNEQRSVSSAAEEHSFELQAAILVEDQLLSASTDDSPLCLKLQEEIARLKLKASQSRRELDDSNTQTRGWMEQTEQLQLEDLKENLLSKDRALVAATTAAERAKRGREGVVEALERSVCSCQQRIVELETQLAAAEEQTTAAMQGQTCLKQTTSKQCEIAAARERSRTALVIERLEDLLVEIALKEDAAIEEAERRLAEQTHIFTQETERLEQVVKLLTAQLIQEGVETVALEGTAKLAAAKTAAADKLKGAVKLATVSTWPQLLQAPSGVKSEVLEQVETLSAVSTGEDRNTDGVLDALGNDFMSFCSSRSSSSSDEDAPTGMMEFRPTALSLAAAGVPKLNLNELTEVHECGPEEHDMDLAHSLRDDKMRRQMNELSSAAKEFMISQRMEK